MNYNAVPVVLSNGEKAMLEVLQVGDEQDVSCSNYNIYNSLDTLKSIIKDFTAPLSELNLGKITMEVCIGFEIESGKILSVITNGSASSSVKLKIEFN